MKDTKALIKRLHRAEMMAGLPLSPMGLKAEEIKQKLKDIRVLYKIIV